MARSKKLKYTARTAEKHVLYEEAVQAPETDAAYIARLYKRFRGKRAQLLREDFCGTAAISCAWVSQHRDHHALCIDLDAATLAWGIEHNLSKLTSEQRERITLVRGNVLNVTHPKADVIAAMNFSYFIFKTRLELLKYFKIARRSLKKDGLFLLDAFGGSEGQEELEERRRCSGFTYVWEHAKFKPVTSEVLCYIHFEFKDGSKMRRAFVYDWRLWSLMEIQEVLREAGFSHVEVHWEGTESDTGKGNSVYRKTATGEAIASWVAYIIALA